MSARFFKEMTVADAHTRTALGNQRKRKTRAFLSVVTERRREVVADKRDAGWSIPVTIAKTIADECLVFGWANVVEKDGAAVVDKQDEQIDVADLEKAAYDFVLHSREAGEMHARTTGVGKLVESIMMTPEKHAAMGLAKDATPLGWWVGFQLEPDVFKLVKSGAYPMFSIGGRAVRSEIK